MVMKGTQKIIPAIIYKLNMIVHHIQNVVAKFFRCPKYNTLLCGKLLRVVNSLAQRLSLKYLMILNLSIAYLGISCKNIHCLKYKPNTFRRINTLLILHLCTSSTLIKPLFLLNRSFYLKLLSYRKLANYVTKISKSFLFESPPCDSDNVSTRKIFHCKRMISSLKQVFYAVISKLKIHPSF